MAKLTISKSVSIIIMLVSLHISSFSQELTGEYSLVNKALIDKSKLILKVDSSFSYKIMTETRGAVFFKGFWHFKNDTVILNVTDPFKDDSLIQKERVICKSGDRNRIRILVQDSIPFTLAKVFVNDGSAIDLDDSAQAFVRNKIRKVIIKYQGMRERIFVINPSVCKDITILLYDKLFLPSIYLMPIRKWLVKKNGLVPLHENNIPYKEVYKKLPMIIQMKRP
jgi:hypothetical protein